MKKILILTLAIFALTLCAVAKEEQPKEIFRISAEAEVKARPDRVSLTFGLKDRSTELKKGRDSMQVLIASAMAFCKKNGVLDKNIQTENISVRPNFNYSSKFAGKNTEITYYDFNQTFTVTLDDMSKYETILYGMLELGINEVKDINFYSSEVRKYKDEARLLAVKAAKEKAALLTNAAGVKLGKVINVSEDTFYYRYSGSMMTQNAIQNSYGAPSEGEGSHGAGQISFKSNITLAYEVQ